MSYKIFASIKFKYPQAKLLYSEYCTFSAQQRYYDFDHVKKQMYKVHRPHLVSGYIQKVSFKSATDDDGNPDWLMCYVPGQKSRVEFKAFNDRRSKNDAALEAELVIEPEASEADAPDDARDLVLYFHRIFHPDATATPTAKDREFAASLITKYGREKARFVVDYSLEEAAATKYKPDMLVGIRKYVEAAIKKFDAREKRETQQNLETRESQFKNRYERYQKQEIDRFKATLLPQELATMEDTIRAELVAEGTFPAMVNLGVHVKLNADLAERAGVLPYEEWRAQQA